MTPYTQNRYAYVGNNPINRWDPTGHWEAGDETLSSIAQAEIWRLTDLYNGTKDQTLRDGYHQEANRIRSLDRQRDYFTTETLLKSWSSDANTKYAGKADNALMAIPKATCSKGYRGWITSVC